PDLTSCTSFPPRRSSDLGAAPRWATLAIALPAADGSWLGAFAQGLFALADRYGVDLVGGDTTRGPLLVVNFTAFGEVPAGTALLDRKSTRLNSVTRSSRM